MNISHVLLVIILLLSYLSIFEWLIHRFPMHENALAKPYLPIFRYLYEIHTKEHHPDFAPNHGRYERVDTNHSNVTLLKPLLLLGFSLIATATAPVWMIDHLTGYKFHLTWFCVPMATLYYILFETLHVAEHKPESLARKMFGGFAWFAFLQEHHRKHHEHWKTNFNLVCPIADYLFNTVWKNTDREKDDAVYSVRVFLALIVTVLSLLSVDTQAVIEKSNPETDSSSADIQPVNAIMNDSQQFILQSQ